MLSAHFTVITEFTLLSIKHENCVIYQISKIST